MPDPSNLSDLINDAPEELLSDEPELEEEDDTSVDNPVDEPLEDEEPVEDEEESVGDEEDEEEPEEEKEDEPEDDDDYVTKVDLDEKPETPVTTTPSQEAEAEFVLAKLQKISVRIINGKDETETVEVYGYGDLPKDYKGIATAYEAGVFQTAVTEQLGKVKDLQGQFRNDQQQKMVDAEAEKENRSIARDLQDLRADSVFPKFKGEPGTREFDTSAGAKEFDRVVAFMNERNAEYVRLANRGEAYRHIGFKEAFELLNPGLKEKSNKEEQARRIVARKNKSGTGTPATKITRSPRQVSNLTDLEEEFKTFTGGQ